MPIFLYTKSKEAKKRLGRKIGLTSDVWEEIRKEWRKNHPFLHAVNKIWDFFYYPSKRFFNKYINVCNHYRNIKWFIQRGVRGWADCDSWGYYDYNAKVNYEVLKYLKKYKNGTPCDMFEYDENRNPTDEEDKKASEKWDKIMDDMIFAFECIVKDGEGDYVIFTPKRDNPNVHCLVDTDYQKSYPETYLQTKEEYDRMKKGMQLFIDHYFSLWD